jgi:LCP family protein required for cell wall assembly
MRKRNIVLIILGATIGLIAITGVIFLPQVQQRWNSPLGPGLDLPTHTPAPISQAASPTITSKPEINPGDTTKPSLSQTAPTPKAVTSTSTPAPHCGGPQLMYILGIGADSGQDYRYGLSDVIRIARIDFVTPKVTVLTIPRDLWVDIPDINTKYDITQGKLNQAYFYGGPGMGYYSGPGGGPGLLARTLDLNFGVRADHYGAVNMQTFVKIVDAVGGIDLYLPEDVDGTSDDPMTIDLGYFTAGQHHFSGEEALRFARIRKKYSDFVRQDNQNMVLCALRSKLKDPAVFAKVPKIIAAFQNSVQTDLSPQQITQLACLVPLVKRENIIFTGFPDEIMTPGRVLDPRSNKTTFVMKADYDVIREYVNRFIAGTWPTQPDNPTCP